MEVSSLRPMQRCFLMPELVDLICCEVNANKSSRLSTLSVLARTSIIFHEPALDYLWSSVGGIDCLVRCMSADVWRVGHEVNHQPTLVRFPHLKSVSLIID